MKKYGKMVSLLAVLVLLTGCGLANNLYIRHDVNADSKTTNVGNPMLRAEQYCKNEVYGNTIASFTSELIYAGKSGNVITITYREYADNIARQPFYQTLTYDLSTGKEITFQGTLIEVVEATNSSITFMVKRSKWLSYSSGMKIGTCGPNGVTYSIPMQ